MKKKISTETVAAQKRHWVRLTRGCNNHCLFCLDSDSHDNSLISFQKIKLDLEKGINKGLLRVVLSGGEPTIHPDFLKIIKQAKKIGYQRIQVITNGRMFFYKGFLQEAIEVGLNEITFSIHGHTAKLHDQLTGIKGSFNQAIIALKNALLNKELIVNIDICINKKNIKYLREILENFINFGVYEFDLLQIVPFGRAWNNRKKLFYNLPKTVSYFKKALELSRDNRLHIWTNRFPAEYLEGFESMIQDPSKLHSEIEGMEKTFDEFLNSGKIPCAGKRCQFCFMEKFCAYLKNWKKKRNHSQKNNKSFIFINKKTASKILSDIKKLEASQDKIVFSVKNYLQLSQSIKEDIDLKDFFDKLSQLSNVHFKTQKIPFCFYPSGQHLDKNDLISDFSCFKNKFNWNAFVNDFIINGYFVKSVRCQKCIYEKKCPGAHINYIRNFGFKSLIPQK